MADTLARRYLHLRLVVYNIRYATGTGPAFHLPLPGAGYLRSNKRVLARLTEFLRSQDADIIGLIEVDTGSIRSGMVNQAQSIADALGHYSIYECKYGATSINQLLPIVRKQSNAFLAAPRVTGERFHYFDTGIKRLIIELELDDVCVFLVHLSLKYRHRQYQLRYLHDLIEQVSKPVIVAGDFNTFWGTHELYLFTARHRPAQRQRRGPALLPVATAARGAGFRAGEPRHRGDRLPHPGRAPLRSPPAGLRFHSSRVRSALCKPSAWNY